MAKIGEVVVETFSIICPYCGEPGVVGTNGAYSLCHATNTPKAFKPGMVWPCANCYKLFRIPTKVTSY